MTTIRVSHFGRRVVRSLPTIDGRIHAPVRIEDSELDRRVSRIVGERLRTRDAMLNAISPGKVLALATVWNGSQAPEIDARLDALRPIVSGFTANRRLNAEPAAPSLDLGRRYVGDIRDILRSGARDSEGQQGEKVDLTAMSRSADLLEDALGRGNPDLIAAAHGQLRRDFEEARERHADSARRSADAAFADRGAREAMQTRDAIRGMNAANRDFWRNQDPQGTPTAATIPTPRPAPTRDWAHQIPGGSPFANGRYLKHSTPQSPSLTELNRRNAEFWQGRDGNGPKDAA